MNDTVTFYHNPQSRGRIVHWMLEEANAPYEIKILRFDKMEHKSPEYRAINPMGKIPAIVHRGVPITETAAICAYLAEAFPAAGLAPALDDPKRGAYLRWMFFGAGCFEPAVLDVMFSRPAFSRTEALGYGNLTDTLNTLEGVIAPGPFILGERFSAADVYIGAALGWGLSSKAVEPRQAFLDYLGRVTRRPPYQRFTQQSEELSKQMA